VTTPKQNQNKLGVFFISVYWHVPMAGISYGPTFDFAIRNLTASRRKYYTYQLAKVANIAMWGFNVVNRFKSIAKGDLGEIQTMYNSVVNQYINSEVPPSFIYEIKNNLHLAEMYLVEYWGKCAICKWGDEVHDKELKLSAPYNFEEYTDVVHPEVIWAMKMFDQLSLIYREYHQVQYILYYQRFLHRMRLTRILTRGVQRMVSHLLGTGHEAINKAREEKRSAVHQFQNDLKTRLKTIRNCDVTKDYMEKTSIQDIIHDMKTLNESYESCFRTESEDSGANESESNGEDITTSDEGTNVNSSSNSTTTATSERTISCQKLVGLRMYKMIQVWVMLQNKKMEQLVESSIDIYQHHVLPHLRAIPPTPGSAPGPSTSPNRRKRNQVLRYLKRFPNPRKFIGMPVKYTLDENINRRRAEDTSQSTSESTSRRTLDETQVDNSPIGGGINQQRASNNDQAQSTSRRTLGETHVDDSRMDGDNNQEEALNNDQGGNGQQSVNPQVHPNQRATWSIQNSSGDSEENEEDSINFLSKTYDNMENMFNAETQEEQDLLQTLKMNITSLVNDAVAKFQEEFETYKQVDPSKDETWLKHVGPYVIKYKEWERIEEVSFVDESTTSKVPRYGQSDLRTVVPGSTIHFQIVLLNVMLEVTREKLTKGLEQLPTLLHIREEMQSSRYAYVYDPSSHFRVIQWRFNNQTTLGYQNKKMQLPVPFAQTGIRLSEFAKKCLHDAEAVQMRQDIVQRLEQVSEYEANITIMHKLRPFIAVIDNYDPIIGDKCLDYITMRAKLHPLMDGIPWFKTNYGISTSTIDFKRPNGVMGNSLRAYVEEIRKDGWETFDMHTRIKHEIEDNRIRRMIRYDMSTSEIYLAFLHEVVTKGLTFFQLVNDFKIMTRKFLETVMLHTNLRDCGCCDELKDEYFGEFNNPCKKRHSVATVGRSANSLHALNTHPNQPTRLSESGAGGSSRPQSRRSGSSRPQSRRSGPSLRASVSDPPYYNEDVTSRLSEVRTDDPRSMS
jgi:hypothetical protein